MLRVGASATNKGHNSSAYYEVKEKPMFGRFVGKQVLKRATRGKIQHPGRMQALTRLPTLLRLGYALFRDNRVPMWQRAGTLGLVGLIMSPLDLPGNVPVLGQFWDLSLAVTVLDLFIKTAPAHVVNEHIIKLNLEKKVPLRPL
jgi:uncharacterized membrane protein YkvA (DUF1232 family)